MWHTDEPAVNSNKLPAPHREAREGGRARRHPVRLGFDSAHHVCDENRAKMTECAPPCNYNAPLSNDLHTTFLLKHFPLRHWGLVATRYYSAGDHVEEYVGEAIDEEVKERRSILKRR